MILFASAHSVVDFSNGASVATLDLLQRLTSLGLGAQAFCTPKLDFHHEVRFEKIVADLREPYHVEPSACGVHRAQVLYTRRQRVPITVIRLDSSRIDRQRPEEGRAVLGFFGKFLEANRPDAVLTYGGDPITRGMIGLARRCGIPVVFALHNFAYTDRQPFREVDHCIVPSEFARRHYRERVGLDCHVLPYPIDWERVRVQDRDPHFLTFVNPAPEKGVAAFVPIARALAARRPDIPILVVESRGDRRTLAAFGFDPSACGNVEIMPHTTDPRRFWERTRVALVPSLWWENQPLVAIEAMINGIPVIGSDRGGIPEALGGSGFTFSLPERLTPVGRVIAEPREVEPWVETIIRLWDDRALYEEQSARARAEALRWDPARINPLYVDFFGRVAVGHGSPLVSPPALLAGGDGLALKPPRRKRSPQREENPAMKPNATAGLTSIIVPCFNQREFTRSCLQSLFLRTRPPWELIVVDNASTDDTPAYLAGLRDAAELPVTIIRNPQNRGFPAAVNQGLKRARGEFLVLLNNDAVVTDDWLDQLIALSRAQVEREGDEPAPIGLVGPMTNYAPPPQLVEDVPYRDLDEMHAFARRWRDEHRGRWSTAAKLSGFCVLIRRAVYEAIGGLDERFGLGLFDDDDLAVRARRAGFELAVAHDLFVHHFGSRTFVGNGIDAEGLLEENARRFAGKWGREVPAGRPVSLRPWGAGTGDREKFHAEIRRGPQSDAEETAAIGETTVAAGPGGTSVRAVRVSLTMIVRDEEENLPHCLGSICGIFDEVVVVDTGSVDRTREIAREHGAKVFEFAWVDDFAAARNAALSHATGEYAFWLDADDVIEPDQRAKLVALLGGLSAPEAGAPTAFVVRCACDPGEDGSGGETVVDHIRLFPIRPDVRWTYRVHEQILPALRRTGVDVRWTDLVVRHTGYADVALRGRKLERDARILAEELKHRPDEPFLLFNLGAIAIERKDWAGALGYLRRSLRQSAPTDSITRKLFALIARAHQMLGDSGAAVRVCTEGLSLDPEDAELRFRKAVVHRHRGESAEAERCWRTILGLKRPEKFASVDMGIYGHLTRRNLAALAAERGDVVGAAREWRAVLAECPRDPEAAWSVHRFDGPVDPEHVRWLIPGSRRRVVPMRGPGDFDPYVPLACAWVRALGARVVVELGVRAGSSTRALLAGVGETDGQVWGVDLADIHGIDDPRFRFVHADAASVADRWDSIDLLHIDTDPHTEEQTRRWFALYGSRCRAIALHDGHHPAFGVGAAVRAFVEGGGWTAHEYWGNPSGWIVLTRPGEPSPEEAGVLKS